MSDRTNRPDGSMEPTPGGDSPDILTKRPLQDITNGHGSVLSGGGSDSSGASSGPQQNSHTSTKAIGMHHVSKAPRHPTLPADLFCTPRGPGHTLPTTLGFTPQSEAMQHRESLHQKNSELIDRLARRRQTDSATKRRLVAQLKDSEYVSHRLGKQLSQSQAELSLRTSMTSSMLSSVPGAQLDQLEQKDRRISDLEREVAQLKERLVSTEAGLIRVASASGTFQPQGADPEALAAVLENSIKANQAESEELRQAVHDMKTMLTNYQRHCRQLEDKAVALEALEERKKGTIIQQEERLSDLEAQLANARSNSWQHSEQVSQLVEEVQQAQGTIRQQARTISQNEQEMTLLQSSLATAEYYLEEAQTNLRNYQAAHGGGSPPSASSSQ